jgi:hypothetical protein
MEPDWKSPFGTRLPVAAGQEALLEELDETLELNETLDMELMEVLDETLEPELKAVLVTVVVVVRTPIVVVTVFVFVPYIDD